MIENRLSGIAVSLFALSMIYLVLPAHTEEVGSGWMKPNTLPFACCVALTLLGAAHAVRGRGNTRLNGRDTLRFFGAILIVVACLWIMSVYGFLPGAIAAMFALMLLSGERRPLLIGVVGVLIPGGSWLIVEQLLARPLP